MKSKIKNLKEELIVIVALVVLLPIIGVTLINIIPDNLFGTSTPLFGNTVSNTIIGGNTGNTANTANEIEEYFKEGYTTLYIKNETQLRALAEYVNAGDDNCKGKEIILANDIKLDDTKQWEPIGREINFQGSFNGNGFTISNLKFEADASLDSNANRIGLFGGIGSYGSVENLVTKDFSINIEDRDYDFEIYTGNIAGVNFGAISNCINEDSYICGTRGEGATGGIVGKNAGTIELCENKGSVFGKENIGGIAGIFDGNIDLAIIRWCYNSGIVGQLDSEIITEANNIGGIVGKLYGRNIKNCINKGNIGEKAGNCLYVGGIVGYSSCGSSISCCTNNGAIEGADYVGGILGYMAFGDGGESGETITISKCLNWSKDVLCTMGHIGLDGATYYYAGGIMGYPDRDMSGEEINNCMVMNTDKNGPFTINNQVSGYDAVEFAGCTIRTNTGGNIEAFSSYGHWVSISTVRYGVEDNFSRPNISYPTFTIKVRDVEKSLTNKSNVTYEFIWSQDVNGFDESDIVVTNGTKGTLSNVIKNDDGTYSYTMDITTTIASGSKGTMKVVIPGFAAYKVGYKIYNRSTTENTITIDREAPDLTSIEVTNPTELGKTYKAGTKIEIKTTFSENVCGTVPDLGVWFGTDVNDAWNPAQYVDEHLGSGTVVKGEILGNVITYTYTIADGDNGNMLVAYKNNKELGKGYTTELKDEAGNYFTTPDDKLTWDNGEGDFAIDRLDEDKQRKAAITADTIAPTLTINGEKTATEKITYTFEFKEDVSIADKNQIKVENGTIEKEITGSGKEYTLEVKNSGTGKQTVTVGEGAFKDIAGNNNVAESISITVNPIEFKKLKTKKIDDKNYVKVPIGMTVTDIIKDMKEENLEGKTPTLKDKDDNNLKDDDILKTYSTINLNGKKEYTVVVNGDYDYDGEVDFMNDLVMGWISVLSLNDLQKFILDYDNSGTVEFFDLVYINIEK